MGPSLKIYVLETNGELGDAVDITEYITEGGFSMSPAEEIIYECNPPKRSTYRVEYKHEWGFWQRLNVIHLRKEDAIAEAQEYSDNRGVPTRVVKVTR